MILVDTPIWIDHFRKPLPDLARLLGEGQVLVHPFVIGELALGSIRDRRAAVDGLRSLPQPQLGFSSEVLLFIERQRLHGSGVGYVDAHLLLAARLTEGASLWTRDQRLNAAAARLGIAWSGGGSG